MINYFGLYYRRLFLVRLSQMVLGCTITDESSEGTILSCSVPNTRQLCQDAYSFAISGNSLMLIDDDKLKQVTCSGNNHIL